MTCATGFGTRTVCRTTAMTLRTCHILTHLELLGHAGSNFLQIQTHLKAQVATTLYLTASAEKVTEATTEVEAIAEDGVQYVIDIEASSATKASAHVRTVETKLVVLLALLLV